MEIVAHSQHETGNHLYSSYVMTSGPGIKWTVVAPYLSEFEHPVQTCPHPNFDKEFVKNWVVKHGVGVAVIGLLVDNATEAYNLATGVGLEGTDWAKGRTPPTEVKAEKGSMVVSEIFIYGETILRFVQYKDGYDGIFLPGYKSFKDPAPFDYGIKRMDHVVGNVWELEPVINNLKKWLGFHVFAFFTKEEIQTEYTSLNSTVMANNYDTVLMPINEPAKKKRESQITEFLKANNGPGVQHIALFTHDIIATIEKMVAVQQYGGFELIPTPAAYYNDPEIVKIMNEHLTPPVIEAVKKFGILVDKDVEGVLLQIFTKPLFDRPTLFVEIIQRICKGEIVDKAGCGGFGKGNFRALFESIERMQAERDMLLEDN
uniref:4-hydroxyphenylpyruvate dioxygenase n=1 Tax=Arcella intermedia TaxID=1963864 RepID=A0A6B2L5Y4_9EUKA